MADLAPKVVAALTPVWKTRWLAQCCRTSGSSPGGLFQRQIVPRAAAPSSGLPRSPAARAGPGVTVFDLAGAPYRAERPRADTSTEAPSGPFLVAEIVAPSVNLATSCVSATVRFARSSGASISPSAFGRSLLAVTTGAVAAGVVALAFLFFLVPDFSATTGSAPAFFAFFAAFFAASLAFFAAFFSASLVFFAAFFAFS